MNLKQTRVILTGANGGIGAATAKELARAGAALLLVGQPAEALQALATELRATGAAAWALPAELTQDAERQRIADQARRLLGGVDVLINNAGVLDFTPFEAEDPRAIERLLQVNVVAPIALTRAVLPQLLAQGRGRIVNIGSTFGSIGFPYFAAYSASKFALRGFSEALRRELDGSGVGVTYIAPRATRTPLNTSAVNRMNEALKVAMDSAAAVGAAIVRAIADDRKDVYLGQPEGFFVRLNNLFPRLVDAALRKDNGRRRKYALPEVGDLPNVSGGTMRET